MSSYPLQVSISLHGFSLLLPSAYQVPMISDHWVACIAQDFKQAYHSSFVPFQTCPQSPVPHLPFSNTPFSMYQQSF